MVFFFLSPPVFKSHRPPSYKFSPWPTLHHSHTRTLSLFISDISPCSSTRAVIDAPHTLIRRDLTLSCDKEGSVAVVTSSVLAEWRTEDVLPPQLDWTATVVGGLLACTHADTFYFTAMSNYIPSHCPITHTHTRAH